MKYAAALLGGALLLTAGLQGAAITSKLDPALSGADIVTFETESTGSYTVLVIDGVTFSTTVRGQVLYISTAYSGSYGATGKSLQNTYANDAFGVLKIVFYHPVSAFAFNWGASDTQWSLSAYDASDTLIETILPPITYGSNDGFTGIKQGSAIIKWALLSGDFTDYIFIDDLRFTSDAPIPEPSTFVLLGLGLAGLAAFRRRA